MTKPGHVLFQKGEQLCQLQQNFGPKKIKTSNQHMKRGITQSILIFNNTSESNFT